MKLLSKHIKSRLFIFLIILFGINSKFIRVSAEKYEINIKDSDINFILRILKKADKRNSPKMITNPDSSKSIIYKKRKKPRLQKYLAQHLI